MEGGSEGGRDGGREGERDGKREEEKDGEREGGRERWGRERALYILLSLSLHLSSMVWSPNSPFLNIQLY